MKKLVVGLFHNSQKAGEAVAELKQQDFVEDLSLIAKDPGKNVETHQIKEKVTEGIAAGAASGGIIGIFAGLIAGLTTVTIGAATFVIGGPLLAAWLAGGAVTGAVAGGVVGALVDAGIPKETAQMFEDQIMDGQVLVAATTDESMEVDVNTIMVNHGAEALETFNRK